MAPKIMLAIHVMSDSRKVSGRVVELRPDDHQSVVISYELGGRPYKASTSQPDRVGLPRFDELIVGDHVLLTYNPKYPGRVIPGDAEKLLVSEVEDMVGLSAFLVLPTLIVEARIRKYGWSGILIGRS
jgi:hypothetical protein